MHSCISASDEASSPKHDAGCPSAVKDQRSPQSCRRCAALPSTKSVPPAARFAAALPSLTASTPRPDGPILIDTRWGAQHHRWRLTWTILTTLSARSSPPRSAPLAQRSIRRTAMTPLTIARAARTAGPNIKSPTSTVRSTRRMRSSRSAFLEPCTGSLACRADPAVRTPLRLAGAIPTRGKISHSLPIVPDARVRLKDGGAPPFSSADRAAVLLLLAWRPPKKIVTPTAAARSLRDP